MHVETALIFHASPATIPDQTRNSRLQNPTTLPPATNLPAHTTPPHSRLSLLKSPMSRPTNTFSTHTRAPSLLPPTDPHPHPHPHLSHLQPPSSYLQSRIASKRTELDNLRQLRDLSADLASQMAALQDKLGVLSDGTGGASFLFGLSFATIRGEGGVSGRADLLRDGRWAGGSDGSGPTEKFLG